MEEIIKHIVGSRLVLRAAWNGLSEQVSLKLQLLGKTVSADALRKTVIEPTGIKRICCLELFKLYFAATYLAMRERGEILFADICEFRELLIGTRFPIETDETRFWRANRRWLEIVDAVARGERAEIERLLRLFQGDLVGLRATGAAV